MNITQHLHHFLFIMYLKGGKIIHIYTKKTMLILNMFFLIMKKKKTNLQDIILVQMYEIAKIQMHFQSNYFIFLLNFFSTCVNLGKILRMKFIYFHLDKV
jgi:hypothetical protein